MSAKCRSCSARVIWVEMDSGRKMPVDFEPDPEGNVAIWKAAGAWRARVVEPLMPNPHEVVQQRVTAGLDPDTRVRRMSHFATCPDAQKHRRKR